MMQFLMRMSLVGVFLLVANLALGDPMQDFIAQGKYREAADDALKQIADGTISPDLYYNLGGCFWRLKEKSEALSAYIAAHRLRPRDADVNRNLQIALHDNQEEEAYALWVRGVGQVGEYISRLECLRVFAFSLGLFFLWLTLCARQATWRPMLIPGATILALILIASGLGFLWHERHMGAIGTLRPEHVPLHAGPGKAETELLTLDRGRLVRVLATEGDWVKVQRPDGQTGWIPQDAILAFPIAH